MATKATSATSPTLRSAVSPRDAPGDAASTTDTEEQAVLMRFVGQCFRMAQQAGGNPEEIYPFLLTHLHHLENPHFVSAQAAWVAQKLLPKEPKARVIIGRAMEAFLFVLFEFYEGDRANILEIVVHGFELLLMYVFPRDVDPVMWAVTQNNLGLALCDRVMGDRADNHERGISAFQEALSVRTREAYPKEWAATMGNLALAYKQRPNGVHKENVLKGIEVGRKALECVSQDEDDVAWGFLHEKLGSLNLHLCHVFRGRACSQEREEAMSRAIRHYRDALTVFSRRVHPIQFANLQYELGNAFNVHKHDADRELHDEMGVAHMFADATQHTNLEAAIVCYKNASVVFTREDFPDEWANIENSLGIAFAERQTGDRESNLKYAMHHFSSALEIYGPENHPHRYHEILKNLQKLRQIVVQKLARRQGQRSQGQRSQGQRRH